MRMTVQELIEKLEDMDLTHTVSFVDKDGYVNPISFVFNEEDEVYLSDESE